MKKHDVARPSVRDIVVSLKSCAKVKDLKRGFQIHVEIVRLGLLERNAFIGSALVDMYCKYGSLVNAQNVFDELPVQDVVSWTTLITGYTQCGHSEEALCCFEEMRAEGVSPDRITLLSLLSACSSSGFMDGQILFDSLSRNCGISPLLQHYTCLVHLFGRRGHLDKALEFIKKVPSEFENCALWFTLLGACRLWGSMKLGQLAFHHTMEQPLFSNPELL